MRLKSIKSWSKNIVCASVLLAIGQSALAYEPPIGIPDPGGSDPKTGEDYGWGNNHPIEAVAPTDIDWSAPNTFYVNFESGSDRNDEGTPENPRKSLPWTVEPGAYIEVHGTRTSADAREQTVTWRCTIEQPCWLRGDSLANNHSSVAIGFRDSSYIFMENLTFGDGLDSNNTARIGMSGSDHMVIRNSVFNNYQYWGQKGSLIGVGPLTRVIGGEQIDSPAKHIVVYNNQFSDVREDSVNFPTHNDQDIHVMTVSSNRSVKSEQNYASHIWFLENSCQDTTGDCVQLNSADETGYVQNGIPSLERVNHVYIGKNWARGGRQGAFGVKQATDVVISQNYIDQYRGGGEGNLGAGIGFQYAKNNLWIIFNRINDVGYGIRQSNTSNTYNDPNVSLDGNTVGIIGNVITNVRPTSYDNYDPLAMWDNNGGGVGGNCVFFQAGSLSRYIINNTFDNCERGVVQVDSFDQGELDISNNIFSGIGQGWNVLYYPHSDSGVTDGSAFEMDNNLFARDDAGFLSRIRLPGLLPQESLSQLQSDTRYCDNCLDVAPEYIDENAVIYPDNSTPLFNDLARGNYALASNSAGSQAGTKHELYDRFEELYGLNIYKDFNGNDRHPTAPSLGAFEPIDDVNAFDLEKLQVKINYPTKNPVYTPNADATEIQFGGHASYENETITVEWVLAQCASDCAEELVNGEGAGAHTIAGSTETSGVVEYPQNNWHVNSQAFFPGRNILIVNAVHPNGEKKVVSLIIESEVESEEPVEGLPSVQLNTVTSASKVTVPANVGKKLKGTVIDGKVTVHLSGTVADDKNIASMRWSCTAVCTGRSRIKFSGSSGSWVVYDISLGQGTNRIKIEATDDDGNTVSEEYEITPEAEVVQSVDTTAPQMSVDRVNFSGSASDDVAVQSVTWSCVSGCSGSGNATVSGSGWQVNQVPISNGNNTIRIEAVDAAGNRSIEELVITK